jgi:hypothetical protein
MISEPNTFRTVTVLALMICMLRPDQSFSQIDSVPLQRVSRPGIGVTLGVLGFDTGLGVEVTSSSFLQHRLAIRVKGGINWNEWYLALMEENATYPFFGASLVFNTRPMNRSRAFIEGGAFVLLPSNKFSDKESVYGISFSTGVEFFLARKPHLTFSYFFGGGLAFCNASAEKLESRPSYGTGLVFNTGLRAYF